MRPSAEFDNFEIEDLQKYVNIMILAEDRVSNSYYKIPFTKCENIKNRLCPDAQFYKYAKVQNKHDNLQRTSFSIQI